MRHATGRRPGIGRALLGIAAVMVGIAALSRFGSESYPTRHVEPQDSETYRLIHAIGNNEKIVAYALSKNDCDIRKKDNIAVAEAIGVHGEMLGIGSIVCLPDSGFAD